jgi:hypothetical protein
LLRLTEAQADLQVQVDLLEWEDLEWEDLEWEGLEWEGLEWEGPLWVERLLWAEHPKWVAACVPRQCHNVDHL